MIHLRWVTDIHNATAGTDLDGQGPDMPAAIRSNLEKFVKAAQTDMPDMVIDTGDDIRTTQTDDGDAALLTEFQDLWSPIKSMSVRLPGNHDVARFSSGDLSGRFGFAASITVQKTRDATIIAWNSDTIPLRGNGYTFYQVSDTDLHDLELALQIANPAKPVLLFSHIPLDLPAIEEAREPWEIANASKSCYYNHASIQGLLERSQLKILTFSGHRHVSHVRYHSDKITHHAMDRFVRNIELPYRPAGIHYADIIVDRGEVNVCYSAATPRSYRY